MSEAQRFPDDYDGIVAGAPANNRIRQTFGFMWSWTATHDTDGTPMLTARSWHSSPARRSTRATPSTG